MLGGWLHKGSEVVGGEAQKVSADAEYSQIIVTTVDEVGGVGSGSMQMV